MTGQRLAAALVAAGLVLTGCTPPPPKPTPTPAPTVTVRHTEWHTTGPTVTVTPEPAPTVTRQPNGDEVVFERAIARVHEVDGRKYITLAAGRGPVLSTIQGDELDVYPGDVITITRKVTR